MKRTRTDALIELCLEKGETPMGVLCARADARADLEDVLAEEREHDPIFLFWNEPSAEVRIRRLPAVV